MKHCVFTFMCKYMDWARLWPQFHDPTHNRAGLAKSQLGLMLLLKSVTFSPGNKSFCPQAAPSQCHPLEGTSAKSGSHGCMEQDTRKLAHTILTQFSTDPGWAAAGPRHGITRASVLTAAGKVAVSTKGAFRAGCGEKTGRGEKGNVTHVGGPQGSSQGSPASRLLPGEPEVLTLRILAKAGTSQAVNCSAFEVCADKAAALGVWKL